MSRLRRSILAGLLAAGLLGPAGCHAPMPGKLSLGQPAATGKLTLTFALPPEAGRQVQYVPVGRTQSVRVTLAGPRYRDASKAGSPKPIMQMTASFDVALQAGNTASVTMSGVPSGHNLTVRVEVFDGPLVDGAPSGKQLETLWGLAAILDGQTSTAEVSWKTTPAGMAIEALRRLGDENRTVATDAAALQALVQALIDDPTPGANHPVLIDGEALAGAIMRHTRAAADWPVGKGYAIPPATDPVLTGVVAQAAEAPSTKVYDLLGREVAADLKLTLGDPISAVDQIAPYGFPKVGPGDWWVFVEGLNGETRRNAFLKRFGEGMPNALPAAFLAGEATSHSGTGAAGLGEAIAPQFRDPHQLALDQAGNLYVADTGNHRIVRIDQDGTMMVVAGNGVAGAAGDGGVAIEASLSGPEGVAVDEAGNIFIADTGNHKIRAVEAATGLIRTVAGTGVAGNNGDGAAASAQLDRPATLALGGLPVALFFHDAGNKLIRKIPLSGGLTGSSVSSLALPDLTAENTGLAYQTVEGVDYLFYCTLSPPRVIRQTMSGTGLGQRVVVAGGGEAAPPIDEGVPGQQVQLGTVKAIAVDTTGNVFISDSWPGGGGRVRYNRPSAFVELFTVLGASGQDAYATDAIGPETGLGTPYGLAVREGIAPALFVATGMGDHRIMRLEP